MNPDVQQGNSDAFKLYPNPNNGTVTLAYSLNENEKGEMDIYTTTGQLVKQIDLSSGNNQKEIDLSGLDAGMYIYFISVNGERKVSDRFAIIR